MRIGVPRSLYKFLTDGRTMQLESKVALVAETQLILAGRTLSRVEAVADEIVSPAARQMQRARTSILLSP